MKPAPSFVSTTNPCKACTPLGAALAFHGIEGAVCLLHGSQGCSTYIRRYLISHFKEPLDVASSNFSEHSAVFGGRANFEAAVRNLALQYQPALIGVATTCLAETMGEDLNLYLHTLRTGADAASLPPVVAVSTAAYRGTHAEGFHDTVRALVEALVEPAAKAPGGRTPDERTLAVFAPLVSPADLRALKAWPRLFGLEATLVPDWSDTLDGGPWDDYTPLPPGGTPLSAIRQLAHSASWVEFGTPTAAPTAGRTLGDRFGVAGDRLPWPLGVRASDRWFDALAARSGTPLPADLKAQRARLVDALVDGHKVVSGRKAAIFGEEDLVAALGVFLAEVGIEVAAAASGGASGRLRAALPGVPVVDDGDFFDLEGALEGVQVDLLIGSSKGYKLSKTLGVPLVRVGFPIHDRFGGARVRLLGYDGALELFDKIVNALLEHRQEENPVGYTYY